MTEEFDWNAYIKQSPYEAFVNSSDYFKFLQWCEKLQALLEIRRGDLRYKNVPKQIIAEETNPFARAKGHPPFCFRFQCLVTGRKSKYIKESEYINFGISRSDAETGGDYNYLATGNVQDRVQPGVDAICKLLAQVRQKAFPTGSLWWSRYTEYLQSDEWSQKRQSVLERDGFKCYATGKSSGVLHVHHLSYRNVGREHMCELVTLCEEAHEAIHNSSHPMYAQVAEAVAPLKRQILAAYA